jgi:hypothetical protein
MTCSYLHFSRFSCYSTKWVVDFCLSGPAEPALWCLLHPLSSRSPLAARDCILSILSRIVIVTFYLFKFEKLLIVNSFKVSMSLNLLISFIYFHRFLYDADFLNCKLDPTKLDYIPTLHHIVNLCVIMFKTI